MGAVREVFSIACPTHRNTSFLEGCEIEIGDLALLIGHTVDAIVVAKNDLVIARQADIHLQDIDLLRGDVLKEWHRISGDRCIARIIGVCDDDWQM